MTSRQPKWLLVYLLAAACAAVAVSAQISPTGALRIVVIGGEDGVNIIQTKTAVQPVVEVRDRNNLPVAGASVTFLLPGKTAAFANNARALTLTTDSAGRASVSNLQAVGKGSFKIQVNASYQGQTGTTSISQTNFTSVADAAKAGKTPGSQSSNAQASNAGSSTSSAGLTAGSTAGAAGGAAGGAGAAGASSGAAAGAGAGAGTGGGLSGAVIGGIVAGGAVGGVVVAKKVTGSSSDDLNPGEQCSAQLAALDREQTAINGATNSYIACINAATTEAAINACLSTFFSRYFAAAGDYCTCLGTNFSQYLTAEERASVRQSFDLLRSIGINVGTLPSCYQ